MEVETRGVVRTMAVVLTDDEAAADVRVADPAACVSLEGTRPEDVAGAAADDPSLLLLLLVATAAEDWAGASDDAGASEVGSAAADDGAGAALEAAGAEEGAGAAEEVADAADEGAGVLAPVPEAWRFSLWCRYSLMPSMCRPSRLKADAMATKAKKATNSHAWRNMVMCVRVSGGGSESECVRVW